MNNSKDDHLVFYEYLTEYDIEDDYFNIWKKTRESYMYLKELKHIYFDFLELEKYIDPLLEKRKKFKRNILDLLGEYEKLDYYILNNFSQIIVKDGKAEIKEMQDDCEIDLGDLISHMSNFIKLKERMDSLQDEVLTHICNQYNDMIKKLCEEDHDLALDYIIKMNDINMYQHFDVHTDLDRIDTIKLDANKNSKLWKNLDKEEKDMLPYYIKVINYDYTLNKRRELFKYYSKTLIETMKLKAIYSEKNGLQEYNNSIKRLTVVSIIIAIMSLLVNTDFIKFVKSIISKILKNA